MLRLVKYLKPYLPAILLAIVLLFVQANADLSLPDYLSKIVNIGVQQGGIEQAVPQAIRQSEMDRVMIFLNAEEKAAVLGAYTLKETSSADENILKTYPALASQSIYLLNTIDQAEVERLNPVMGKALLAVYTIEQIQADPAKAKAMMGAGGGFDLSKLPAGTDLFALLAKMPAAQTAQITAMINQKMSGMGSNVIVQAAAAPIKAEYQALGMDTARLQTDYILRVGGIMLLLSLLTGACTVAVGYLSARAAAGFSRDLRKIIFEKVSAFSSAELDKFSTASLITRTTNDVTQIQMVVIMMVRMVAYAPIVGVGGIIRAIGKDASMWWIIALAVMILMSVIVVLFSVTLPRFKLVQKLIDRLNLVTRENLSGMMVIRAFNRQDFEEERFDRANNDLTGTMLFVSRVMVFMMPFMMLVMNGLSLLIIWVGAHQVAESAMQVGDMMAFMQYAIQIVFSFLMLSFMFIILPRAEVSADRIADVLETKQSICDPEKPQTFPAGKTRSLEFRHVSFRFPGADENVLCNIDFTALPGQTTAIIGATGSGKSTLVNLIPRFHDVTDGAILIDGVDIRQVTQHDLREKIGYVPQKSNLFSGTIESNLRYADEDASQDELMAAADVAQASEFINAGAEGLATEIAQGGGNVSGGQKQRLSIARALVKKAPVYIFDDSFSALDFKTDAALRKALKEKMADSILLVVTQRVSTIKKAEQIIVLEDGNMVGKGTHQELLANCETYREIALSQLSMEELA
ncbi:MAG TPA: ABC transporter ATP-binding protein [Anaerolineaceae bacterium]|nr:ABC transporter ATP-binding protein [Anaerolineaceae bacterium]HPN50223.1 ABC transporter ATP-binding protein [Anaerolineaceae bacterium]